MAMTGTPSMAASSMSDRHNPVLPLPVMPTQTAWVDEVARVVEHRLVQRVACRHVVSTSEVEEAQLFEVLHRGMVAGMGVGAKGSTSNPRRSRRPLRSTNHNSMGTDSSGYLRRSATTWSA